jgi:hypothetical protein
MTDKLQIGEYLETAIWLSGTETQEDHRRFSADVRAAFEAIERQASIVIGPIEVAIKRPGEDRVPSVPPHIAGPDVRLLVANAMIVARRPENTPLVKTSFLADLDPPDLARLRALTKAGWRKAHPKSKPLNDEQADIVIETLGPEAAMNAVREAVNNRTVH